MNSIRFPSHGSAAHAAQALNHKLNEIAAGVRELGAQQGDPPPAADPPAAVEEPAGGDKAAVVASLPQLNPSLPAAWSAGAQPAVGAAPARLALPAVPDLRPELAALTFALNQQHAATAGALRQMVGLCQRQQQQIQWILREIETLTQRLNRVPYC